LDEIFQICDRATILRDGALITTVEVADTNRAQLIRYMVGRDVDALASRTKLNMVNNEIILNVKDFSGMKFKNISFQLHRGEILGFFGLVGAGRTELMRAIVGIDPKWSGTLYLHDKRVSFRNTHAALRNGIGLLPEDRKTQGFLNLSTNIDNTAISSLRKYMVGPFVSEKKKLANCEMYISELKINPPKAH
jgi:ribose transport system ATP-binding protein